mgnify:CR=1 FL=1
MFAVYNLLGCSYWVSSAANYIFGSILSFFLNKHFTFQNQSKGIGVVLKFTVNIVVCYLLAYGIAKPAVRFLLEGSSLKVQDNLSMLAGMVLLWDLIILDSVFLHLRNQEKKANREIDISILGKIVYDIARKRRKQEERILQYHGHI